MREFNQENINTLTDFILNNERLRPYIVKEDWKKLFRELLEEPYSDYYVRNISSLVINSRGGWNGFLYYYFEQLDNFNIMKEVEMIPDYAFSLQAPLDIPINIPINIKYLGRGIFYHSDSRIEINYEGTIEQWNSINKHRDTFEGSSAYLVIHCKDGDIKPHHSYS